MFIRRNERLPLKLPDLPIYSTCFRIGVEFLVVCAERVAVEQVEEPVVR
jgi:hypothetical protein